MKPIQTKPIRMAIFGFGGLGKGMARLIPYRPDFKLVALADSKGYCVNTGNSNILKALDTQTIRELATPADYPLSGQVTDHAIIDLLQAYGDQIDAVFMALPNLPVNFFHDIISEILEKTTFEGVFVDALKRTEAVESLFALDETLKTRNTLYITGAGATPGFLTTIAAVAAHSFIEVLNVDICFGVGIGNWEAYKATVREDFIHLAGFDAKRVACMSDEEIEAELEKRNGILELHDMEHADDIILALAGVCPKERVKVGGIVDTRNAKKPVSTTVTVTGRTMSGAIGSHQFIVSDEATMVDNVCGPALGFLLRGVQYRENGHSGLVTSADLMPRFASQLPVMTQPGLPAQEVAKPAQPALTV